MLATVATTEGAADKRIRTAAALTAATASTSTTTGTTTTVTALAALPGTTAPADVAAAAADPAAMAAVVAAAAADPAAMATAAAAAMAANPQLFQYPYPAGFPGFFPYPHGYQAQQQQQQQQAAAAAGVSAAGGQLRQQNVVIPASEIHNLLFASYQCLWCAWMLPVWPLVRVPPHCAPECGRVHCIPANVRSVDAGVATKGPPIFGTD